MAPQSTTKLASLKLGLAQSPRIKILYQENDESQPFILYDNFPKDLAVALSGFIARAMNAVPLNQIALSELKPKSNAVTITRSSVQANLEVFNWILACGEAGKTVNYRSHFGVFGNAFSEIAQIYLASEQLQVSYLPAQLMTKMGNIAARQIHSAEVEKVFMLIQGSHKIKTLVCESIATAMWENRCKAVRKYNELCQRAEMKEFAEGLNMHYHKLEEAYYKTPEGKADLKVQGEKKVQRQQKKQEAAERREQNYKNRVARAHNVAPEAVTVTGNGSYTTKVEGARVRKAQGNRPGYVALDLAKMGVESKNFRPKNSDESRRRRGDAATSAASSTPVAAADTADTTMTEASPVGHQPGAAAAAPASNAELEKDMAKLTVEKK